MGYSPWGHKESDTTEHHEMDPFNRLVAKQVSGTFKEELFQKETVTKIYAWSHFPSMRKKDGNFQRLFKEKLLDFQNVFRNHPQERKMQKSKWLS